MTSWAKLVPVKRRAGNDTLLFAEDFGDAKEIALEICNITPGSMTTEDGQKATGIVEFWDRKEGRPKKKRLALNRTNQATLQTIFGPDFEAAVGWVVLYVSEAEITDRKTKQRVRRPCIRIKTGRPDPKKYPPSFDYAQNVAGRREHAIKMGWTKAVKLEPVEVFDVREPEHSDLGSQIAEQMERQRQQREDLSDEDKAAILAAERAEHEFTAEPDGES